MTRLAAAAATLVLGACAANYGGPRDIEVPTVALHADDDATPAAIATILDQAGARAAFVASKRDAAWFTDVAGATDMHLSGPAPMGAVRMAFLGPEPVGDTTHTIEYEGGALTIQDALYEIDDDRLLDLIALRLEEGTPVREAVGALLAYVATDVDNAAALVIAVMVPDAATGNTLARMLGPAYYDTLRCDRSGAGSPAGEHIRMFYGPEARMFCAGSSREDAVAGERVRAELVMGRR